MSIKHPIISVTGSSGAGTSTVKHTFEQIFRREGVEYAAIEGDSYHAYDREEMKRHVDAAAEGGNNHFCHFGPEANLLKELEQTFATYGQSGQCRIRQYVHNAEEEAQYGVASGHFSDWKGIPNNTDLLFYEGLHGAIDTGDINVAQHADLKIGVVPVINLEWIQKIQSGDIQQKP
jgi:phosphoribulokinase